MSKTSVLAKLVAKKGKAGELMAAFEDLFSHVEGEKGTEIYVMNQSSTEPETFWFYELYADDEALGVHGGSDAMQRAGAVFGPLLESTELILGKPVRAKGLAL